MLVPVSIAFLIVLVFAYELKDYQIAGPDWIRTEIYDVVAKTKLVG